MKLSIMLQATSLFGEMSSKNILKLEHICQHRDIAKKQFLFHEQDSGKSFFLLAGGKIQLSKTSQDGRQSVIKVVKPGEIFAEVVLDQPSTYPVTAQALSDSSLYAINTEQFFSLLLEESFLRDFIGVLMRKQRFLTDKILSISTKSVEQRFVEFLKTHFGQAGTYPLNMSKKDIASAIGTTPESLSRLIGRLEKQGCCKFLSKQVTITALPCDNVF